MWKSLATEPTLTAQVLELLLEKVNRDVPYKENKSFLLSSGSERVATVLPLAVSVGVPFPAPRLPPFPNAFFISPAQVLVPGAEAGNNASLRNAY